MGPIMPIQVSWGNEGKTYTLFCFTGRWTWDEYHAAVAEGFSLVKDIPYTVNILIDMTDCHLFPQNLLSHFGSSMSRPPKAFDLAVVVTSSKFIEVLAAAIEGLYGRHRTRFRIAKTLDEAHRILAEFDAANSPPPAVS